MAREVGALYGLPLRLPAPPPSESGGETAGQTSVTIEDPGPGVSPEVMLDVINELRAAGAEAVETNDAHQSVRVGVDTWVVGTPGSLTIDGKTLSPPYSILAIGDPPTLAAFKANQTIAFHRSQRA